MKRLARYFFMTLIILQGLFVFFWYVNYNFLGILSWIGRGEAFSYIKFFLPLVIFGAIKICYWVADPLSKLFIILLKWVVFAGIIYLLYWIFLV